MAFFYPKNAADFADAYDLGSPERKKFAESLGADALSISVAPMTIADLCAMLPDTIGGAPERFEPLAQIILEKTGGNPFFVRQFLLQLAEAVLISYKGGWQWDEAAIRQASVTDNVSRLSPSASGACHEPWRELLETSLICAGVCCAFRKSPIPRNCPTICNGPSRNRCRREMTQAAGWAGRSAGLCRRSAR